MFNPLNNLNDAKSLIDSVTGKNRTSEAIDLFGDVIYVVIDFFVQLIKNPLNVIVPLIQASRPFLILALVIFIVLKAIEYDTPNKNKHDGTMTILIILIVFFSLFI